MRRILAVAEIGGLLLAVTAAFLVISMAIVWIVGRVLPLVPGNGRRKG